MTKEELLNMKLHEEISLDEITQILRVFGGWIYYRLYPVDEGRDMAVFVPETLNVYAKQG